MGFFVSLHFISGVVLDYETLSSIPLCSKSPERLPKTLTSSILAKKGAICLHHVFRCVLRSLTTILLLSYGPRILHIEVKKYNFEPFLAASTECSAGSNDHLPSLVQFDGRPLDGANIQY
jgi:hypothetical protein